MPGSFRFWARGQRDIADGAPKTGAAVVRELARRRRAHRMRARPMGDRLTDAYSAVLAGVLFLPAIGTLVADEVSGDLAARVRERGAATIGVAVAILVGAALRSGARGGPLVLSPPDVHHLLLAPIDHSSVLLARGARFVAVVTAAGAVAGATTGAVVGARIDGHEFAWMGSGAVAGAIACAAAAGVALLTRAHALSRGTADAVAAIVITAAVGEAIAGAVLLPTSWIASVAIIPTRTSPAAWLGVAVALAAATAGVLARGSTPPGVALARSATAAELTAAIALQDVRGVVRAAHGRPGEAFRVRPWTPPPGPRAWASWRRSWLGLLRFPGERIVRLGLVGVVVGWALAVSRTVPAAAAIGVLAMYGASLELVEPLAQESDRPTRRAGYPRSTVGLYARLLGPPAIGACAVFAVVAATAGAFIGARAANAVATVALPAAFAAVASAAYAVARGRPDLVRYLVDPTTGGVSLLAFHAIPAVGAGLGILAAAMAVHDL